MGVRPIAYKNKSLMYGNKEIMFKIYFLMTNWFRYIKKIKKSYCPNGIGKFVPTITSDGFGSGSSTGSVVTKNTVYV